MATQSDEAGKALVIIELFDGLVKFSASSYYTVIVALVATCVHTYTYDSGYLSPHAYT